MKAWNFGFAAGYNVSLQQDLLIDLSSALPMKKSISGIELKVLVQEFQSLVGAKVDKIFQQSKEEFYFRLHKTGLGKVLLRIVLPDVVYIAKSKAESPEQPSGFCMYLRKHLANARVREISQFSLERILKVSFETKSGDLDLILEFFSKGNLILVKDNIILSALHHKKWKDREILPRKEYQPPPARADPFDFTGLASLVEEHGTVVKALAIGLGLGGQYANAVLDITGADGSKASVDADDEQKVIAGIDKLRNMPADPAVIRDDTGPVDVVPYVFSQHEKYDVQRHASFNDALDSVLGVPEEKQKKDPRIEKAKRIIESQEEQVQKFDAEIEKGKKAAEAIYSNYGLISGIYSAVQRAREKDISWSRIKEELEKQDFVISVDTRSKRVTIEVQ